MKFYDKLGEEHNTLIGAIVTNGINKVMGKTAGIRNAAEEFVQRNMNRFTDDIYVDSTVYESDK